MRPHWESEDILLGSDRREASLRIDVFSSPLFIIWGGQCSGKREFLGDVRLALIVGYRCYLCTPARMPLRRIFLEIWKLHVLWHKYLPWLGVRICADVSLCRHERSDAKVMRISQIPAEGTKDKSHLALDSAFCIGGAQLSTYVRTKKDFFSGSFRREIWCYSTQYTYCAWTVLIT